MNDVFGLKNRKALITGSVTGIGRSIAEALAGAGASIVAHGLDGAAVRSRAAEWQSRGFDTCESVADLAQPDGVAQLKADVSSWGLPDVLVLNASIEISETWEEVSLDAMQKQAMVNVHASLLLIQTFLPGMIDRGWGRVLAIGSVQETKPNPRHIAYAATKAAQTNCILNMARQTCMPNITFNVLKPGAIATDRTNATLSDPDRLRKVLSAIPLGRIGTPRDCAAAALLLCSEAGSYINGAELHVDGGMRL